MEQEQNTQYSDKEATRQVKQLLIDYGLAKPSPFEQFKSDLKTPGGAGMVIAIGSFMYLLVEHLTWWKAALLAWLMCMIFIVIVAIFISLKASKK